MKCLRLSVFLSIIFIIPLWGNAQQQLTKEEVASRLKKEKKRDIKLPSTDWRYKVVKHYVEETPDSAYFHAAEDAYEAYRDMKFGLRIHWGIHTINQVNGQSWGFLEPDNADKRQYQQLYKIGNSTGFNADEWMNLFQRSGLKCFAFTSKNHEVFSMFDNKTLVKNPNDPGYEI